MSRTCNPQTLVDAIKLKIADVIDGNNPSNLPVEIGTGVSVDRTIEVLLGVSWRWESSWKLYKGKQRPSGGIEVRECDEGNALLGRLANKQAAEQGYISNILADIASDPSLSVVLSDALLANVAGSVYYHETCNNCNGNGTVPCLICTFGKVQCTGCNGHGKPRCSQCGGSGSIYLSNPSRRVSCSYCGATGRSGYCTTCCGSGKMRCTWCGGSTVLNCGRCGATGHLTNFGTAEISSTIERHMNFPDDSPPALRAYFTQKDGLWIRQNADYVLADSFDGNARGGATIVGAVPYAAVPLVVAGRSFTAEAIGTQAEIVKFPEFLDLLLRDMVGKISTPDADTDTWFSAVRQSKLLTQLFNDAIKSDKNSLQAAHDRSHGSASIGMLTATKEAIDAGAKRIGTKGIYKTWRNASIGLAVASLIFAATDAWRILTVVAKIDPIGVRFAMALWPLLILVVTWMKAQFRWEKEASDQLSGCRPTNGPRHFWYIFPLGFLLGALNLGAVDVLAFVRGQMIPAPTVEAIVVTPAQQAAVDLLTASDKPALKTVLPAEINNSLEHIERVKTGLARLGIFHGPINLDYDKKYVDAVKEFQSDVRYEYYNHRDVEVAINDALQDRYRLDLMQDVAPIERMSNIARSNLSQSDIRLLFDAVAQARENPRHEITWQSKDGTRSGRVIAVRSSSKPENCDIPINLGVEVEINGGVERASTGLWCMSDPPYPRWLRHSEPVERDARPTQEPSVPTVTAGSGESETTKAPTEAVVVAPPPPPAAIAAPLSQEGVMKKPSSAHVAPPPAAAVTAPINLGSAPMRTPAAVVAPTQAPAIVAPVTLPPPIR